jgi:predicted component of type VI protein secretion system
MVRSNEMEEQHSKKRRGKATSTRKEDTNVLCHRKKKSEELAELVAQQFKVPPFKEKYFSTDLL